MRVRIGLLPAGLRISMLGAMRIARQTGPVGDGRLAGDAASISATGLADAARKKTRAPMSPPLYRDI